MAMSHVNLLGDDKPSQTDQPPQIPRTVALQTSDTPTAINELSAQVVFPRHEKRNRELNINCVARVGLIHEQLLSAAWAKSLDQMEYLHGHLASVTEPNNDLAGHRHRRCVSYTEPCGKHVLMTPTTRSSCSFVMLEPEGRHKPSRKR